jgi:hypothetical protein
MITAYRVRGYDYEGLPYMSPLYLRSNTLSIWERSFKPCLDPTQWPPYHSFDYVSLPDLMKVGKGRRKKKRLKGDMDAMRGYDEDMYGGGDFNETVAGIFAPSAKNMVTRLAGTEDKGSRSIHRTCFFPNEKVLIFLLTLLSISTCSFIFCPCCIACSLKFAMLLNVTFNIVLFIIFCPISLFLFSIMI